MVRERLIGVKTHSENVRPRRDQHFRTASARPRTTSKHVRTMLEHAQGRHPQAAAHVPLPVDPHCQDDEEGKDTLPGRLELNSSTQTMGAVVPKRTESLSRHLVSLLALSGALFVITLYLLVPLMIFFGFFHDGIAQFLSALLVLTLCEYGVYSLVVKTAKPLISPLKEGTPLGTAQSHSAETAVRPTSRPGAAPDFLAPPSFRRTTIS